MNEQRDNWGRVFLHLIYLSAALVGGWFLNREFGAPVAVLGVGAFGGVIIYMMGVDKGTSATKAGMESAADALAESERSRVEAAKAMVGAVRILQEVARGEAAGMKTAAQIEGLAARLEYEKARTRQRHRLQDERSEDLAARRAEERRPTWQEEYSGGNDTADAAGWRRVE